MGQLPKVECLITLLSMTFTCSYPPACCQCITRENNFLLLCQLKHRNLHVQEWKRSHLWKVFICSFWSKCPGHNEIMAIVFQFSFFLLLLQPKDKLSVQKNHFTHLILKPRDHSLCVNALYLLTDLMEPQRWYVSTKVQVKSVNSRIPNLLH